MMWKVLIADDEPKIRRGLKDVIEAMPLPLEVVGEARNGVEALEKSRTLHPDILLLDICMPKLNGIEFLRELKKAEETCRVLVISGYHDFAYARDALNLGVLGYLLKPISEEELRTHLEAAIEELEKEKRSRRFMRLIRQQIEQNGENLRTAFFNDWLDGILSREEWEEQKDFLGISIPARMTMVLVAIRDVSLGKLTEGAVSEELFRGTLVNVMREALQSYETVAVFVNRYQDIVAILSGDLADTQTIWQTVRERMNHRIGGQCCVQISSMGLEEVQAGYDNLRTQAAKVLECRPIVAQARQYLYAHYQERELDLPGVANAIGCNHSYLSRMMKQELGMSFKDFLTALRIGQAIQLMRDPNLTLAQIAEMAGYNNQHYFSAAFKNCQGVSPSEFRRSLSLPEGKPQA